jgi:hypothetical protein
MTPASSIPLLWGLSALSLVLVLGGLVLFIRATGRMDLRRSVLIHVPLANTWQTARNLPWLVSRHLKIEGHGGIDEWILREGDGAGVGSLWRGLGRWNGSPYWVDIEMAIVRTEHQLAITLQRDSLGTHLRAREHLGTLTLEQSGPGSTKATWHLTARLIGLRSRIERCIRARRLQARLLDLSLRSIKSDLERDFDREATALLLEEAGRGTGDRGSSISPGLPAAGGPGSRPGRSRPGPPEAIG